MSIDRMRGWINWNDRYSPLPRYVGISAFPFWDRLRALIGDCIYYERPFYERLSNPIKRIRLRETKLKILEMMLRSSKINQAFRLF